MRSVQLLDRQPGIAKSRLPGMQLDDHGSQVQEGVA
jgi:hypothetical protein